MADEKTSAFDLSEAEEAKHDDAGGHSQRQQGGLDNEPEAGIEAGVESIVEAKPSKLKYYWIPKAWVTAFKRYTEGLRKKGEKSVSDLNSNKSKATAGRKKRAVTIVEPTATTTASHTHSHSHSQSTLSWPSSSSSSSSSSAAVVLYDEKGNEIQDTALTTAAAETTTSGNANAKQASASIANESSQYDGLDVLINGTLVCPHGRLAGSQRRRVRLITSEAWEALMQLFPLAIALPFENIPCGGSSGGSSTGSSSGSSGSSSNSRAANDASFDWVCRECEQGQAVAASERDISKAARASEVEEKHMQMLSVTPRRLATTVGNRRYPEELDEVQNLVEPASNPALRGKRLVMGLRGTLEMNALHLPTHYDTLLHS
jgi:hypothetical protein